MGEITTYNRQEVQKQFSSSLFVDFVQWIDRSEKTTRSYLINLRQFMTWLLYADIKQPQRQDIISYRQWLATEHDAITADNINGWKYRTDNNGERIKVICKPNTIKAYLRVVCQFFKWAAANGFYPDIAANIHAPKVNSEIHQKDALTAAEVLKIENSIKENALKDIKAAAAADKDRAGKVQRSEEQSKRLLAMYLLAVNAGLRTIEISRANVKDLEEKGGQAWLYIWGKGHTQADRKKPLAAEIVKALKDYLACRSDKITGSSPLFVSTGNRSAGKRIAPTTISTMLKQAMQQAGFNSERLTAHSLRHTTGTNVQELTNNIYTTQLYMRHASPATTEIYLHNDTDKQEADTAQQLYNYYHGIGTADKREKLASIINRMTPAQLDTLADIAAAMG